MYDDQQIKRIASKALIRFSKDVAFDEGYFYVYDSETLLWQRRSVSRWIRSRIKNNFFEDFSRTINHDPNKLRRICNKSDFSEYVTNEARRTRSYCLNTKVNLLPIRNGEVANLSTGSVRPRIRDDKFTCECNLEYVDVSSGNQTVDNYLSSVFFNDPNLINFVLHSLNKTFRGAGRFKNYFCYSFDRKFKGGKNTFLNLICAMFGRPFCKKPDSKADLDEEIHERFNEIMEEEATRSNSGIVDILDDDEEEYEINVVDYKFDEDIGNRFIYCYDFRCDEFDEFDRSTKVGKNEVNFIQSKDKPTTEPNMGTLWVEIEDLEQVFEYSWDDVHILPFDGSSSSDANILKELRRLENMNYLFSLIVNHFSDVPVPQAVIDATERYRQEYDSIHIPQ